MTYENFISALNASCKKGTSAYKLIISLVEGGTKSTNKLRTCWTSGSGRFTSNLDYTTDTFSALNKMGLPCTKGNDAPRGGQTGNFVEIAPEAVAMLLDARNFTQIAIDEAKAKFDAEQKIKNEEAEKRQLRAVAFAKANPQHVVGFQSVKNENSKTRKGFWGAITFKNSLGVSASELLDVYVKVYGTI